MSRTFSSRLVAGLIAAFLGFGVAQAQELIIGGGVFGARAAAYTPSAVHFNNGVSQLETPDGVGPQVSGVGITNPSQYTVSFWLKTGPCSSNQTDNMTGCFAQFAGSSVGIAGDFAEGMPGHNIVFDSASGNYGTLRLNVATATSSGSNPSTWCGTTAYSSLADSGWHHYLLSLDGTGSGTAKAATVYKDGVQVATGCTFSAGGVLAAGLSARGFAVKDTLHTATAQNGNATFDLADLFEDFTTAIVCTSTSNITVNGSSYACPGGAGSIPAALLSKFYSSGPVDLGTNCATPTGRRPEICYRGNKTAWATNVGTVTNMSLVANLYDAPTGPNTAPAHRAYYKWFTGGPQSGWGTTSTSVWTNSNAVASTDYLLLTAVTEDTSGTTNHGFVCPTGWTQLAYQLPQTGTAQTSILCGISGASAGAGPWTLTYTSKGGRGGGWQLLDMANVNSVDGSAAAQCSGCSSTTTTATAPSVTATASNDTLVNIWQAWGSTLTTPSSQVRIVDSPSLGSGANMTSTQEFLGASGTTGTRTGSFSPADGGNSFSVLLKPN